MCNYKLGKKADEVFHDLKEIDSSKEAMNAMAKLSFEDSVNIAEDTWDEYDWDKDDLDENDWNIDYTGYNPNQIIAIKLWVKSAQDNLDWAYYNLFFHDIHNKDNSVDYYLKAYKIKKDVASFIDEYRNSLATDVLTNWKKTYYENTAPFNDITMNIKRDHNIWVCIEENNSCDIALYWVDSQEALNKPLPFYSLVIKQLIIITDTTELYDLMDQEGNTSGCIVILTDLTQCSILSKTNKLITQDKIDHAKKCFDHLLPNLKYHTPRWKDENHDRLY